MAIPSNVQNAIDNGYEFRLGDYISQGFRLVTKNTGTFIAGALVFFVIVFATSMLSSAVGAMLTLLGGFAGILLTQIISQVASAAVTGPMLAGFFNASHKTDAGKSLEFGDFFAGFSKWTPLFITTIMTTVVVLAACIPGIYLMMEAGLNIFELQGPRAMEVWEEVDLGSVGLGALVAFIPAFYLSVSYAWAPMLTWFYDISGWEALEASRKLAAKNFLPTFGLMVVLGIIMVLGVVALCVGILFTFPAYTAGMYAAFADIFGLNTKDENEGSDFIDHFAPNV